jgi:hypothetical protein
VCGHPAGPGGPSQHWRWLCQPEWHYWPGPPGHWHAWPGLIWLDCQWAELIAMFNNLNFGANCQYCTALVHCISTFSYQVCQCLKFNLELELLVVLSLITIDSIAGGGPVKFNSEKISHVLGTEKYWYKKLIHRAH